MDGTEYWTLFVETGCPVFYLLYKQQCAEEEQQDFKTA